MPPSRGSSSPPAEGLGQIHRADPFLRRSHSMTASCIQPARNLGCRGLPALARPPHGYVALAKAVFAADVRDKTVVRPCFFPRCPWPRPPWQRGAAGARQRLHDRHRNRSPRLPASVRAAERGRRGHHAPGRDRGAASAPVGQPGSARSTCPRVADTPRLEIEWTDFRVYSNAEPAVRQLVGDWRGREGA